MRQTATMDRHYLAALLAPESIVVFADKGDPGSGRPSLGASLDASLRAQRFSGTMHFIDVQTRGTLAELASSRSDLAIIALPPRHIAEALQVAGRIACRAALIVSSGIDAETATELTAIAHRANVRLLGPNSLGFQRPSIGLNASAIGPLASAGSLALASQSGSLTASMLDWASRNGVGFSTVVSLGPNTSVDIAQVLDFLATDAKTQSIVVYLEGIVNARCFMSALRSAANAKPVVVLKAGRRLAGNKAAQTHSGTIVGSDDVFDAALRRAGAVRVRSFVELFSAAKCLASRYRPTGNRLAVVTNGGGPGVLAADWINEIGLQLGTLSAASATALKERLPPLASLSELIDLSEDADAGHFRAAIEAASADRAIDGILVIFSPKTGVDAEAVAQAMVDASAPRGKPLLACWMGDSSVIAGRKVLNDAAVPSFRTPEAAVGAFGNISSFHHNQKLLQQTPPPLSALAKPDVQSARLVIDSVLAERRNVLTETESKALLSAFHIPITETVLARSATEAMMVATQLGFPVALKIDSPDISHKSDVQGVALNVMNAVGARDTYLDLVDRVARLLPSARINGVTVQKMARAARGREVCIGLTTDDPFGPVIVFGAGGTMIDLLDDRAMELPPLNQFLARRLIERARVAGTLAEWRGAPAVDLEALEHVLLRVSEMVCELPQLREMDINPIIVDASGAVAVDARIVVDGAMRAEGGGTNQYDHLAILPYPSSYERRWPMQGGGDYTVRPVHPDDGQMLQALVQRQSSESRYFRFASLMHELPPSMLARFTLIDYDREMAMVAVVRERTDAADGTQATSERIIGVSRYITQPDRTSCEFGLLVDDAFVGKGLGSRLMETLMQAAREKGLAEMIGLVLANNTRMLAFTKRLGFVTKSYADDPSFRLVVHVL